MANRFPQNSQRNFRPSSCVQTGSGAHRASCTVGTGGSFRGGFKVARARCWSLTPSIVEVKNEYKLYLLSPQAPPWHVAGQFYVNLQLCARAKGSPLGSGSGWTVCVCVILHMRTPPASVPGTPVHHIVYNSVSQSLNITYSFLTVGLICVPPDPLCHTQLTDKQSNRHMIKLQVGAKKSC
jgi:hypothetical protein